jgi:hypothetical protein
MVIHFCNIGKVVGIGTREKFTFSTSWTLICKSAEQVAFFHTIKVRKIKEQSIVPFVYLWNP